MKDGTIQKSDDDVLVYAVRGEKWRGRKSVELEVEGGGGEGGKRSGQENKITARGALAKDFDCIREVLNFFAVQKVAPLTS